MPHRLITTTAQLSEFCHTLSHVPYVAIDTEFIREKTYYPQLCLVQVAGPEAAFAIDPLAEGMDLTPLTNLLSHEAVLKVFHAGRQDIEIFFNLTGKIPTPLFDTQIAAQACGFGESVSYSDLVSRLLKVSIDKASRYTDWAKRPLTDRQITYALDDVIYLRGAYELLEKQLRAQNRTSWVQADLAALISPALYAMESSDAWRRIKSGNLKPKQLAVLREVTAWREDEARKRDIPRGRVLRDETLVEIAASMPQSDEQLRHIRGLGGHFSPKWAEAVLTCVNAALAMPSSQWPESGTRNRSQADNDLVALLQLLLKLCCTEHEVTPRLIAERADMEALALGEDNPTLYGWRFEIFGAKAKALVEGKLHISWDARQQRIALEE